MCIRDRLGFYPVKKGSQNGTYEADIAKDKIDLKPGIGDDSDVYYVCLLYTSNPLCCNGFNSPFSLCVRTFFDVSSSPSATNDNKKKHVRKAVRTCLHRAQR